MEGLVLGVSIIPLILLIAVLVSFFKLCKTVEEIKETVKSQEQFLFSISAKLNSNIKNNEIKKEYAYTAQEP